MNHLRRSTKLTRTLLLLLHRLLLSINLQPLHHHLPPENHTQVLSPCVINVNIIIQLVLNAGSVPSVEGLDTWNIGVEQIRCNLLLPHQCLPRMQRDELAMNVGQQGILGTGVPDLTPTKTRGLQHACLP